MTSAITNLISGTANFKREIYCILGLPFDAVTMDETIHLVKQSVINRTPFFVSTPNLNFLMASMTDSSFRQSVINSELSIVDGMPIVWLARILGLPIKERVPGSSMFERICSLSDQQIKVYFFGGKDGVAEKAYSNLNLRKFGAICLGYDTPGFCDIEKMSSDFYLDKINAQNVDFLIVALGAQKGNAWIERNRSKLNVPVVSHLGAVINFVAGDIKRAPPIYQSFGLEWLWRIYQEPYLWRRYVTDGISFINLFFTKVFPYAFWLMLNNNKLKDDIKVTIAIIYESENLIKLKLTGACLAKTISPIRDYLQKNSSKTSSFEIDLSQVDRVDSAFIGLCMLISSDVKKRGGYLTFVKVKPIVVKIFKWNCAEFLL